MRLHSILLHQKAGRALQRIFQSALAAALLFFISQAASAQCVPNPTGETAVRLQNDSSFPLTFYIDNVKKEVVKPGDKSAGFVVKPERHIFYAETVIAGASVWVTLITDVPEGHICTWTVLNPGETASRKTGNVKFVSSLRRK